MKKCLIKGMTVIMISTMLASIPVVSYAAETEPIEFNRISGSGV